MVKRVKVPLIGSGRGDDPYAVPLPTFIVVSMDLEKREAIAEVPDEYFTKLIVKPDGTVEEVETDEIQVEKLRSMYRRAWGRFKPHEDRIRKCRRVERVE